MRALLLLLIAAPSMAQECVPRFYKSEPRDSEWFYGAGKGADASKAREDALRHLARKALGADDAHNGGALAGWEQDDHEECEGAHYVLARIEQDRVKRNLAAQKPAHSAPAPAANVTHNVSNVHNDNRVSNVTYQESDKHYPFLIAALFALAALGVYLLRPRVIRYLYKAPSSGGPAADFHDTSLSRVFKAAPRASQQSAMAEISKTGLPAYFLLHRGEGTCRAIAGTADMLKTGILDLCRGYTAGGWKVTWDEKEDACFAVLVQENLVMGFAFLLYRSEEKGRVDCEIAYAITAPIEDGYRAQMEEGLHQGLPWSVQAAAAKLSSAKS